MCFVSSSPKTPAVADPNVAAQTASKDEEIKRRKAKGYGAALITGGMQSSSADIGRQTIAGA